MIIKYKKQIAGRLLIKLLFVVVLSLAFLVFLAKHALAEYGVSVSPIRYSFEAKPGSVIEDTLVIINPNDFAIKGETEFQDFKIIEGNDIQWIPGDVENPYKMSDWFDINRNEITLGPKEEVRLPFKVEIPATATVGGHYAALFFKGIIEGGVGSVGVVPRVGSLVLLNVLGEMKRTGQLIGLSVPSFVSNGPIKLTASFINTGTTHYETKADFSIKNFFWKSADMSSKSVFVYPEVKREVTTEWNNKFPFGVYTAQVSMKDGEGNTYQKSKIFVGLPYKYLLIFLGVVIVLWAGVVWFKKKFKLVERK
ncbi:MAG: hypothetical protein CEN90_706 [Parcubacteria group bacterium Licking1014_17]|nr:MAG: hypothetical protein CEN90_706 [Parcubacteria group bacterium Licking1014_17]